MNRMDLFDFYKDKRILVTGHTGFKGAWMCFLLSEAGARVSGYALEPSTSPSLYEVAHIADRIENSIIGDVRDLDALRKAFDLVHPEIVIHMAAQPIVRESYKNPVYTYDVNVMGTVNVLECCRLTESVKSVINVTTDKVYKNNEWSWGYRENEELNGYDPYSNSKSCSELVTYSYKNAFLNELNIAVSTCRAGNVIGGGDYAIDRIIPDCVRAAAEGVDTVVRNPYSTRPYQHVLEPVYAYLMVAMEQYLDYSKADCYNVGPDEADCLNTGSIVDMFCEKWNKRIKSKGLILNPAKWINKSDNGPHEASYLKLDCSKLKNTFGWSPRWNTDIAMNMLVEWYQIYLCGGDISDCMSRQIKEFMA